jgi:choline transporter-like protein 2/4/5
MCVLILFIVTWVALICLAIYSVSWGNPARLLYGEDYEGNLCGVDGRGKNQYYYESQMQTIFNKPYNLLQAVCVSDCPEVGDTFNEGVNCAVGCSVTIPTQSELYVCLPTNQTMYVDTYTGYEQVVNYMDGWDVRIKRYVSDVETSWPAFVLLGCIGTPLLSYIYISFLKRFSSCVIYSSMFLMELALLILIVFTAIESGYIADENIVNWHTQYSYDIDHDYPEAFATALWFLLVLEAIVLCLFVSLWSRIELAVKILREACHAVCHVWFMSMFPLIPALMYVGLLAYFVIISAYILTCETNISFSDPASALTGSSLANERSTTFTMQAEKNMSEGWIWFHLFGFLWTGYIVEAITICTVAGATCEWYWTADKTRVGGVQPIWDAFYRCWRFHFGSLALGSLFIAVIELFRILLSYVDRQTRVVTRGNGCIRVLSCCCACCLWCLRKFIRYVNKNTYIMIAMKGKNLCPSMYDSFELISANLLRVATAGIASAFVLFIGKLAIVGTITSLGLWWLVGKPFAEPFWPLFTLCLLAYFICCFFLHVYDIAVDTILLCICEDEKINVPGNYFASAPNGCGDLQRSLDTLAEHHALEAFKLQDKPRAYERAHDESQSDRGAVENPAGGSEYGYGDGDYSNPTTPSGRSTYASTDSYR